jgi:hypothetical protein
MHGMKSIISTVWFTSAVFDAGSRGMDMIWRSAGVAEDSHLCLGESWRSTATGAFSE